MPGRGRVHQVADVHGVEGAAEDPDPLVTRCPVATGIGELLTARGTQVDSTENTV